MSDGELAQLARASVLHAEGQRFESVILHAIYGICFFWRVFKGVYVYSKRIIDLRFERPVFGGVPQGSNPCSSPLSRSFRWDILFFLRFAIGIAIFDMTITDKKEKS